MHFMDDKLTALDHHNEERPKIPVHPGVRILRQAIRGNIVSFPSQIPSLLKEPAEAPWRVVALFFLRGWAPTRIAARFQVPVHRIRKSLDAWCVRAFALGYLQVIDQEAFARCCADGADAGIDDSDDGLESGALYKPAAQIAARGYVAEHEKRMERARVNGPAEFAGPVTRLDVAIARCSELRDDFRSLAATLLRELRAAEELALELRQSRESVDAFVPAYPGTAMQGRSRLGGREEEQISHAVI
jgi:hypothetical protein